MEYFWTHEYDLPAGVGYAHWSAAHLLSIAVLAMAVAVCLRRAAASEGMKRRMIRILPVLLVGMELGKDLYLCLVGHFGLGYLPLHLCSMGIPVFLLAVYVGRLRAFFTEVALILILPGSVCAILFPDWNMYPVWNFMNLYSWVWHGLLVLFPLLLILDGWKPVFKSIWKPVVFLLAVVPPIYAFDRWAGCNYLFVNWPPEGTPLVWLAGLMGVPGYLAGYALLAAMVMLAMYFFYGEVWKGLERRARRGMILTTRPSAESPGADSGKQCSLKNRDHRS